MPRTSQPSASNKYYYYQVLLITYSCVTTRFTFDVSSAKITNFTRLLHRYLVHLCFAGFGLLPQLQHITSIAAYDCNWRNSPEPTKQYVLVQETAPSYPLRRRKPYTMYTYCIHILLYAHNAVCILLLHLRAVLKGDHQQTRPPMRQKPHVIQSYSTTLSPYSISPTRCAR